jgi:hypothetical protein
MRGRSTFDYAVVRVVPRVEREEFLNVGVILSCPERRFLGARVELDPARLAGFAPWVDVSDVRRYLEPIVTICAGGPGAGPIGLLPQRQRFHWLVAPRSTVVQMSPVHSGFCDVPETELEHLLDRMVRPPLPDHGHDGAPSASGRTQSNEP